MIPVYQDKFVDPTVPLNSQRGNCFSAVLASLLELPLAAVPNFVEIDVLGGPNWWWLFHKYVEAFWEGLRVVECRPRSAPAGRFYAAGGLSVRATEVNPIHHSVVMRDGWLVHDPHPAGGGLLTVDSCWFIDRPVPA